MDRTPHSIPDYDAVMDPIRAAQQATNGNQPGDPAKAAQVLLPLVAAENRRRGCSCAKTRLVSSTRSSRR